MGLTRPRALIDFETRSACDLRKCGAWIYSKHPTTEILCLAFRLPYWEKGETGLWVPDDEKFPYVVELLDWELGNGGTARQRLRAMLSPVVWMRRSKRWV